MPFQDAEDYFQDEYFLRWARASGADEAAAWAAVLHRFPGQEEALRQARYLFRELRRSEAQREVPQTEARLRAAWTGIQEQLQADSYEQSVFHRYRVLGRWLAAACVVGTLGVIAWWWVPPDGPAPATAPTLTYQTLVEAARQEQPLLETRNTSGTPQTLRLSDGSQVRLSPGSRLSYPDRFRGPRREVVLTGDAFFEVRKNPAQPFYVFANELVTKVLGTSFRVRAFETDRDVIVTVQTGRVSVYARTRRATDPQAATPTLVLTPNQRAVYRREAAQLHKDLIERPALLVPPAEGTAVVFDEASIATVFAHLERAYGVRIVYDADALAECTLTATLADESLHEKLNLIGKTLGLRYEVMDAQIVVTGRGCR